MDEGNNVYGSGMVVTRLKNRFKNPTPSGFRDINATLRLCLDPCIPVYHSCELQIHCRPIKELALTLSSHSIYEYFRTYFRGCVSTVQSRLELLDRVLDENSADTSNSASLKSLVMRTIGSEDPSRLESTSELLRLLSEHDLLLLVKV